MAKIVLGMGTSHSPMLSLPSEHWSKMGENDKRNQELMFPANGKLLSYEDGLEQADPSIAKGMSQEKFDAQYEACQKAISTLMATLKEAAPDVAVIVSDDQDEFFFEDNMPTFSIYWGDTIHLLPMKVPDQAPPHMKLAMGGYGDVEMDVPVNAKLGRHLIEHMNENDFDVAHFRYLNEQYGGAVARRYPTKNGESEYVRTTEPRPQGLPHGFSFVIKRIMDNKPMPIVPVLQNTCYPPNQPTPKRCYNFGRALRQAIEDWDSDARVAVIASGGLSHFVVDEEIDRMALKGMEAKDAEVLSSLPRQHLYSASSEILNWVTASGACEHLNFDLVDYVPVYRSPAGTGGGWGFARWI